MIYLDNAATTLKKPITVRRSVNECIKKFNDDFGGYEIIEIVRI